MRATLTGALGIVVNVGDAHAADVILVPLGSLGSPPLPRLEQRHAALIRALRAAQHFSGSATARIASALVTSAKLLARGVLHDAAMNAVCAVSVKYDATGLNPKFTLLFSRLSASTSLLFICMTDTYQASKYLTHT